MTLTVEREESLDTPYVFFKITGDGAPADQIIIGRGKDVFFDTEYPNSLVKIFKDIGVQTTIIPEGVELVDCGQTPVALTVFELPEEAKTEILELVGLDI